MQCNNRDTDLSCHAPIATVCCTVWSQSTNVYVTDRRTDGQADANINSVKPEQSLSVVPLGLSWRGALDVEWFQGGVGWRSQHRVHGASPQRHGRSQWRLDVPRPRTHSEVDTCIASPPPSPSSSSSSNICGTTDRLCSGSTKLFVSAPYRPHPWFLHTRTPIYKIS